MAQDPTIEFKLIRELGAEVHTLLMNALKKEIERRASTTVDPSTVVDAQHPVAIAVASVMTGALEGVARFAWPFTADGLSPDEAASIAAQAMASLYQLYLDQGFVAGQRTEAVDAWLGIDGSAPAKRRTPPKTELN